MGRAREQRVHWLQYESWRKSHSWGEEACEEPEEAAGMGVAFRKGVWRTEIMGQRPGRVVIYPRGFISVFRYLGVIQLGYGIS